MSLARKYLPMYNGMFEENFLGISFVAKTQMQIKNYFKNINGQKVLKYIENNGEVKTLSYSQFSLYQYY